MTTTVQQLVEGAYNRSTANDPGKLATDVELIGEANRVYHLLFATMAAAAPERFVSRASVALTGAPAAGTLSTDVIDVRRVQNVLGAKVHVIPVEELDKPWHLAPAVYRQGAQLVSRAALGDPSAGDVLTVWQLDAPADLTTLASVLDARYPTRHVRLLILILAVYLDTKDSGRDAAESQKLTAERDLELKAFAELTGLSMTALSSPHAGILVQHASSGG